MYVRTDGRIRDRRPIPPSARAGPVGSIGDESRQTGRQTMTTQLTPDRGDQYDPAWNDK